MNSWWLVNKKTDGHVLLSPLGPDKEIAVIDARNEWLYLSDHEKSMCDKFYAVLCEDGNLGIESWKECIDIKEMEK